MSAETAKVFRGGVLVAELPARELVPGDVVEIHTGDKARKSESWLRSG